MSIAWGYGTHFQSSAPRVHAASFIMATGWAMLIAYYEITEANPALQHSCEVLPALVSLLHVYVGQLVGREATQRSGVSKAGDREGAFFRRASWTLLFLLVVPESIDRAEAFPLKRHVPTLRVITSLLLAIAGLAALCRAVFTVGRIPFPGHRSFTQASLPTLIYATLFTYAVCEVVFAYRFIALANVAGEKAMSDPLRWMFVGLKPLATLVFLLYIDVALAAAVPHGAQGQPKKNKKRTGGSAKKSTSSRKKK